MLSDSSIFHKNGIAIKGYDVVAYFHEEKAIKGNRSLAFQWANLEWRFSSNDYLNLFKEEPKKYLPEYGGYCAFGASEGYKARINPQAFTIHEGKLYLNFAKYVRKRWLQRRELKIQQADNLWEETKSLELISAHPIPIWWKYQLLKLVGKDLFK